jgi:hypothetical protein
MGNPDSLQHDTLTGCGFILIWLPALGVVYAILHYFIPIIFASWWKYLTTPSFFLLGIALFFFLVAKGDAKVAAEKERLRHQAPLS